MFIAEGKFSETKDGKPLISEAPLEIAAMSAADKELVARAIWFAGQMIHKGSVEWLDFFEAMLGCGGFDSADIGYGTPDEMRERLRLGYALQKMMKGK